MPPSASGNALYLPHWTVLKVDGGRDYVVQASYDLAPEVCAKCGVIGQLYRHGMKAIRYRDAPVHGKQTIIEVRRARFRCRACEGTFMQHLPDMDDDRRMTHRCRDYIVAQCLLKPNTHVAEDVGIDEKVVRQIGRANADRLFAVHAVEMRAPRILGMDELNLGDHESLGSALRSSIDRIAEGFIRGAVQGGNGKGHLKSPLLMRPV